MIIVADLKTVKVIMVMGLHNKKKQKWIEMKLTFNLMVS